MDLLTSFIQKDITELRRSRKMILVSVICLFYPIVVNILTDRPLLPPILLMLPLSMFTACAFGGELLHCFTINEIKYRIFDIFLVSKIRNVHLLLCKVVCPALCSFLLSFASMIMNQIFVEAFPQYEFVFAAINLEAILILLVSALFGTLVQFATLILIKNPKDYTLTATLAGAGVPLLLVYAVGFMFGMFIFFVLIIAAIVCLVFLNCHLIDTYTHTKKSKSTRFACSSLFPNKTISQQSALLRKEILVSGVNAFSVIRLLLSAAFPMMTYSFAIQDMELLRVFFRISLYFVCTFGVLNILFPVAKAEQLNRYVDIFRVAKMSKRTLYFSKAVLPFLTMFIGLSVSILGMWIYCHQTNHIFLFDYATVLISILSTACSVLTAIWLARYIHSYQDVRSIGFFLSAITFAIHAILSFVPYWFF